MAKSEQLRYNTKGRFHGYVKTAFSVVGSIGGYKDD